MHRREDSLNSRGYADQIKIARSALKAIQKINQRTENSKQKHGDYFIDRINAEYIFFNIRQLRMICFDYTFAAFENFLEHIGYILFSDWDSNTKQKHYDQKRKKLLLINEAIEKEDLSNLDYTNEWCAIIQSMNLGDYNQKRNPIKHIHSENHDARNQTVFTNNTEMTLEDYESLTKGTSLALTDNECHEFVKKTEDFINLVHAYVNKNQSIFQIYCEPHCSNQQIDNRKELLETFLAHPFSDSFCLSESTITAKQT